MNLAPSLRSCGARLGALLMLLAMLLPATPAPAADAVPTKESAVALLRGLFAALQAQDYAKAATYFQMPPGITAEVLQKEAAKFIERNEISAAGIETLAAKGKWGKLAETVEPARAQRFAEKFGVPVAECYGLMLGNAEAGFFWDGKQFKLIRCDDIGKLPPN